MKRKLATALFAVWTALAGPSTMLAAESQTSRVEDMIRVVLERYKGDVTREQLEEAAIQGLFSVLDSNSKYFGDQRGVVDGAIGKDYVGIGAKLTKTGGKTVVEKVLPGYAAEKAGLAAGDELLSVDGGAVDGKTLSEIAALIAGSAESVVLLKVRRSGEQKEIAVAKQPVQAVPESIGRVENVAESIQYIEIVSFGQGVSDEFGGILREAKKDGTKSLIVDLRNNQGGLLAEVVKMCQELVPEGPIAFVMDKNGKEQRYASTLKEAPFRVAVLVNEVSASASEIFASSIQESGTGIVVGERTFGKGTVQQVLKDSGGNYFKLTTAEYLTRNRNAIQGVGVRPDVEASVPGALWKIERSFAVGDAHEQVRAIEETLDFLGYEVGTANDVFDQATARAVTAFQKAQGLYGYGVCDLATQKALERERSAKAAAEDVQLARAIDALENGMGEAE